MIWGEHYHIDSSEIENLVCDSILHLERLTALEVADYTYFRRVLCVVYDVRLCSTTFKLKFAYVFRVIRILKTLFSLSWIRVIGSGQLGDVVSVAQTTYLRRIRSKVWFVFTRQLPFRNRPTFLYTSSRFKFLWSFIIDIEWWFIL
jgi:hypothetical protein